METTGFFSISNPRRRSPEWKKARLEALEAARVAGQARQPETRTEAPRPRYACTCGGRHDADCFGSCYTCGGYVAECDLDY